MVFGDPCGCVPDRSGDARASPFSRRPRLTGAPSEADRPRQLLNEVVPVVLREFEASDEAETFIAEMMEATGLPRIRAERDDDDA